MYCGIHINVSTFLAKIIQYTSVKMIRSNKRPKLIYTNVLGIIYLIPIDEKRDMNRIVNESYQPDENQAGRTLAVGNTAAGRGDGSVSWSVKRQLVTDTWSQVYNSQCFILGTCIV